MKRVQKQGSSKLTPDFAVQKVARFARLAEDLDGVKEQQRRRIVYAFQLLQGMFPERAKRTERYRTFLKLTEKKGGRELVAAVAAALGLATIANMKEIDRLELPSKISMHEASYKLDVFKRLAQECWSEGKRFTSIKFTITYKA